MTIIFKLVKPPLRKLRINEVWYAIQTALVQVGKEITQDFEKTTQTWTDKPEFQTLTDDNPPSVLVGTDDLIYKFVSGGTKVRYATMTNPFQAKTQPGVIGSRAGVGGMLFISKKHPRPGIKARKFEQTIQKKWKASFKRRMKLALTNGLKRSGHYISK